MLIETEETDVTRIVKTELAFMVKLERQLGEQKIDVLVDYPTRKLLLQYMRWQNKQVFYYEH